MSWTLIRWLQRIYIHFWAISGPSRGASRATCLDSANPPSHPTPCSDKLDKAVGQERIVIKAGEKVHATLQQVALISVKVRE